MSRQARDERGLASSRCTLSTRCRPGSGIASAGRGDFARGVDGADALPVPAAGSLNRTRARGDLTSGSLDTGSTCPVLSVDDGGTASAGIADTVRGGDLMAGED